MGLDLLDRNWREPPAIDADVTALGVADQVAVAVAVEVDRAVVRVAPHPHRIMAEHELEPVGHLDVHQFLDLLPERRLLQTIGVVVVAGDEELLPIEATEIGSWSANAKSPTWKN